MNTHTLENCCWGNRAKEGASEKENSGLASRSPWGLAHAPFGYSNPTSLQAEDPNQYFLIQYSVSIPSPWLQVQTLQSSGLLQGMDCYILGCRDTGFAISGNMGIWQAISL